MYNMKTSSKPIHLIIAILLLISQNSLGQNQEQSDSLRTKLTNAAKEIIASAGTCALITLDENGLPNARTMDPFLPESDFTVWFGTNPKSRKVKQIENNSNVTLYYLDKNTTGYVVLHGKAQLIDDLSEKEKHWKTEWEAFYPNKTNDYLLIKVVPKWMEVLSISDGILGNPTTWEVSVVEFDSDR